MITHLLTSNLSHAVTDKGVIINKYHTTVSNNEIDYINNVYGYGCHAVITLSKLKIFIEKCLQKPFPFDTNCDTVDVDELLTYLASHKMYLRSKGFHTILFFKIGGRKNV